MHAVCHALGYENASSHERVDRHCMVTVTVMIMATTTKLVRVVNDSNQSYNRVYVTIQ